MIDIPFASSCFMCKSRDTVPSLILESVHRQQLNAPTGLHRGAFCDFLSVCRRGTNVSRQQHSHCTLRTHVFPLQSVNNKKKKNKSITASRDYHLQDYLQSSPVTASRYSLPKNFVPSDLNLPFSRPLRELWGEKYKEW